MNRYTTISTTLYRIWSISPCSSGRPLISSSGRCCCHRPVVATDPLLSFGVYAQKRLLSSNNGKEDSSKGTTTTTTNSIPKKYSKKKDLDDDDDDDDDDDETGWVPPPPNNRSLNIGVDQGKFSSSTTTTTAPDMMSKDWIPPKRPLVGDLSYPVPEEDDDDDDEEEEEEFHEIVKQRRRRSSRVKLEKPKKSQKKIKKVASEPLQKRFDQLSEEEIQERLQKRYEQLKQSDREMMAKSTTTTATKKPPPSSAGAVSSSSSTGSGTVDWLKTRRSKMLEYAPLGSIVPGAPLPADVSVIDDSNNKDRGIIPVVKHTLLTDKEILTVLHAYGGVNPVVILDNKGNSMMGSELGMVVVTAPTFRHLSEMATQLVKQLRARKLQEAGVDSARDGPQGNHRDPRETWVCVDCKNYIVHIQMESVRKHVDLEFLYSGKDPVRFVNVENDEMVDAYVAAHPAPLDYGLPVTNWDMTMKQLAKNRYTAPHRPVVDKAKMRMKRKMQKPTLKRR